MLSRPSTSILFIYALTVSLLAYAYRSVYDLLVIGVVNGFLGFLYGYRYRLLWFLLILGFWGTFINAITISNTGPVVYDLGFIVLREGAVKATLAIFFRLLSIVGATLFFIGNSSPYEIIKSLVAELRIPKGIAFSLAYAIRLIPLMRRDYEEIRIARLERGYRRIPYLPGDLKSFLLPLLSIAYERAVWAGISVELKGFRISRPRYKPVKIGFREILVLTLLVLEIIVPVFLIE